MTPAGLGLGPAHGGETLPEGLKGDGVHLFGFDFAAPAAFQHAAEVQYPDLDGQLRIQVYHLAGGVDFIFRQAEHFPHGIFVGVAHDVMDGAAVRR